MTSSDVYRDTYYRDRRHSIATFTVGVKLKFPFTVCLRTIHRLTATV